MKAYKVEETDSWGYTEKEKYWVSLEKAEEDLSKRIEEYKEHEDIAKDEDLDAPNFQPLATTDKSVIKNISVCIWESSNTDCGKEWDIKSNEIRVVEIEIN